MFFHDVTALRAFPFFFRSNPEQQTPQINKDKTMADNANYIPVTVTVTREQYNHIQTHIPGQQRSMLVQALLNAWIAGEINPVLRRTKVTERRF